jgi:hypothetical protein
VKALLELPLPLIFVSLVVGPLVGADDLSGALLALMVTMVVCMAITLLVPERPRPANYPRLDWDPLVRLLLMTCAFTAIILTAGAVVNELVGSLSGLSPGLSRLLIGSVGLLGMGVAAVLGVWTAIGISFGAIASTRLPFTWWVVNRLVFLVAANGMGGFMLFFLQERFAHLPAERAAGPATTAMMLVGICLLITALPSGWLADRVDKRRLLALSGGLATVGMFVVMLLPGLGAVYGGGCLIGTAIGLFYPANWALGTNVIPQGQAGRYLGLSNLAGAGAGAIGAYIGGPIADRVGYAALFGIYGTLFSLSALALAGIREGRLAGERPQGSHVPSSP